MPFPFLTREVFDALILMVIVVGLALAAVRLYADYTRAHPRKRDDVPDNRDH